MYRRLVSFSFFAHAQFDQDRYSSIVSDLFFWMCFFFFLRKNPIASVSREYEWKEGFWLLWEHNRDRSLSWLRIWAYLEQFFQTMIFFCFATAQHWFKFLECDTLWHSKVCFIACCTCRYRWFRGCDWISKDCFAFNKFITKIVPNIR